MKKFILIFTIVGLTSSIFLDEQTKIRETSGQLDFELLRNNREALFKKVEYKNGREGRDYSYCENESSIYDVIDEPIFNRLIIVCKFESKTDYSHVRYFKYSKLNQDGTLIFCGWRDFDYSHNAYTKSWEHKFDDGYSTKAYSNGKSCTNFDIKEYNHGA